VVTRLTLLEALRRGDRLRTKVSVFWHFYLESHFERPSLQPLGERTPAVLEGPFLLSPLGVSASHPSDQRHPRSVSPPRIPVNFSELSIRKSLISRICTGLHLNTKALQRVPNAPESNPITTKLKSRSDQHFIPINPANPMNPTLILAGLQPRTALPQCAAHAREGLFSRSEWD